jgi:excisionase family DNA binding protein
MLKELKPDANQDASFFEKEWLDSAEAASYLGISQGSLRNMTSARAVPHYKLGKRLRFRTAELRQLLLSNKIGVRNAS